MDLNAKKELVSLAYVRAVAAYAGLGIQEHPYYPDDDSIDVQFTTKKGRRVQLAAQLKCTALDPFPSDVEQLPYDLPIKNYDDLRIEDVLVPRVLIIVTVPPGEAEWYAHSETELLLRRCGYYVSLAGAPEKTNKASVRVHLPRANVLSPAKLSELMAKIERREPL